jgi:tetratricopeptide (TPR) repeat protein
MVFASALFSSLVSGIGTDCSGAPAQTSQIEVAYKEAMKMKDSGHPLEARTKLQWICSQPNATPPMYCALAETYIDFEGKEDSTRASKSAIDGLFIALQKDPQCGHAYNCLASFANLKGDYAGAAQYATKALSVKKPDPSGLRQRALAYSHMNRLEDAIKDQQAFINMDHKIPVNYMLLGDLQQAVKKYSDAEASYRAALSAGIAYHDRSFNLLIKCLRLQGKEPQIVGHRPE